MYAQLNISGETVTKYDVVVHVPAEMADSVETAVLRVGYLYPDLQIEISSSLIGVYPVSAIEKESVAKELKHLLYREHIRATFASYRQKALSRVYGGRS